MDISKNFTTLFLASFISMILFYAMHLLIKRDMPIPPITKIFMPKIIKMPKDTSDQPVIAKPKAPPHVTPPPPIPVVTINPNSQITSINTYIPPETGGYGTGIKIDGEHITMFTIAPQYPQHLVQKCIEGSVIMGFTVASSGAVASPYIVSSTHQGFERSALTAIKKFKFKPKMVDGQAVASPNARYKLSYKLEDC